MRLSVLTVWCGLLLALFSTQVVAESRAKLRWVRSKPPIDSIVVEGNQNFKDSEIRKRMYSRVKDLWRVIRGDRRCYVQRETVRRDTLEVKYLYMSNGFLEVGVQESFEVLGDDSAALVRIIIDEGRRFHYGDTRVVGDAQHDFVFHFQKIARKFQRGKPVDAFALKQAVFDMKTHMANHGFPYAAVSHRLDTTDLEGFSPVEFRIKQDSLVRFGVVTIDGTNRFPEYVARRELRLRPGAVYRRDDILDSRRRLFESGYFSTLQLRMAEGTPDRLNPDFVLRVREREARYLSFRTGAGQSEVRDLIWDVSTGFGKRNFFGSRRYELTADYSFSVGGDTRLITHRYRLRFTEPWFLGIRMPLSFTFQIQPRVKDPINDFDKRSWSTTASTWLWLTDKTRASLGIEYEFVKITGVPEEQIPILKELTDNTARRKIFGAFRRDSRDDLFIPSRGIMVDISGEVYGGFLGGDEDFFKIQASWSRYEVIWPGWISATRLMGSWSEAFGESDEVPLDEAIYLGGANTVRSFTENSLGRFEVGEKPVGSKYTLVFNQEFRWRTAQILTVVPVINNLLKSFPLWQSLFFDVGNGYRQRSHIKFANMAFAYGTGFQIMSPAGPIRIDYARRIANDSFDYAQRWHFTILYAF